MWMAWRGLWQDNTVPLGATFHSLRRPVQRWSYFSTTLKWANRYWLYLQVERNPKGDGRYPGPVQSKRKRDSLVRYSWNGIAFDGNGNGEMCVETLDEVLEPRLGDTSRRFWFHQDGAPPSMVFHTYDRWNARMPGNLSVRCEHVKWPPGSPDLSSLDFYLYRRFKSSRVPQPVVNSSAPVRMHAREMCQISMDTGHSHWKYKTSNLQLQNIPRILVSNSSRIRQCFPDFVTQTVFIIHFYLFRKHIHLH